MRRGDQREGRSASGVLPKELAVLSLTARASRAGALLAALKLIEPHPGGLEASGPIETPCPGEKSGRRSRVIPSHR